MFSSRGFIDLTVKFFDLVQVNFYWFLKTRVQYFYAVIHFLQ